MVCFGLCDTIVQGSKAAFRDCLPQTHPHPPNGLMGRLRRGSGGLIHMMTFFVLVSLLYVLACIRNNS